ncbi:MAG: hypothetical protein EOM74_02290 [Methanomicrobia archaeon]|nr:hypothetical protein [Methanomicrobia archaeon]
MKLLSKISVLIFSVVALSYDAVLEKEPLCKPGTNHSYQEVVSKEITWSNIFNQTPEEYFVYFYSPFCGHCLSIKDLVIGTALCGKKDIYFVVSSIEVIITHDTGSTIGATSIEEMWIGGYPTLLQIRGGALMMNIAGATAICDYLTD